MRAVWVVCQNFETWKSFFVCVCVSLCIGTFFVYSEWGWNWTKGVRQWDALCGVHLFHILEGWDVVRLWLQHVDREKRVFSAQWWMLASCIQKVYIFCCALQLSFMIAAHSKIGLAFLSGAWMLLWVTLAPPMFTINPKRILFWWMEKATLLMRG